MNILSRKTFLILFSIGLSVSSCSVTRSPIHRIYFPEKETTQAAAMEQLADELTNKLRFPVNYEKDDLGLYAYVADWIGTPYRFGGSTVSGTDCSGFVHRLYNEVYKINVPRTSSASLMATTSRVSKGNLREGDLVFFNINNRRGGRASHVGVYLKDGRFAHATTQNGVIISSLSEPYYRRTYLGGGRVK